MSARSVSATWLALALGTFTSTGPALAGKPIPDTAVGSSTVHIVLGDPSSTPPLAKMTLIAKPDSVASGKVTFAVTNTSKTMEHELLVLNVSNVHQSLPYNEKNAKVIEDRVDKIGDSGDLHANSSTTFAVSLKLGRYLLICNEAGHYRAGMRTWLTVESRTLHPVDASP